jgi:hypothetical protein
MNSTFLTVNHKGWKRERKRIIQTLAYAEETHDKIQKNQKKLEEEGDQPEEDNYDEFEEEVA